VRPTALIGADRGHLSRDDAESATEVSHQQVSRWRKHLRDVPKYGGADAERPARTRWRIGTRSGA
jgi:hypothetical protein